MTEKKSLPLPDTKITIIIEKGDDITTVSIPLGSNVTIADAETVGNGAAKYLAISCYALFDIDRNGYYQVSTRPVDPDNLGDHIVLGED